MVISDPHGAYEKCSKRMKRGKQKNQINNERLILIYNIKGNVMIVDNNIITIGRGNMGLYVGRGGGMKEI